MELASDESLREQVLHSFSGTGDILFAPSGDAALKRSCSNGVAPRQEAIYCDKRAGIMDGDVTIVVVDDDQLVRKLIEDSLAQISKDIASFADCWSAWMHIKSNCTSLVISDVHMSGMNGLDLLQGIKRVFPQIKCIMISADYSSESSVNALQADAFLRKPFDIVALIQLVKKLLTTSEW